MAEVLARPNDASRDRRLAALLRSSSSQERLTRLDVLLERRCDSALGILKAMGDPPVCSVLMAKHLPRADASSIKLLLRVAIDTMGEKKLVPLIMELATQEPKFWEYAAYWLPSLVSGETWSVLLDWRKKNAQAIPDSSPSEPRG